MKACLQLLTIQLATDENQRVHAIDSRRPRALQLAVEHHMHSVEHISTRLTFDGYNSLHSKDIGTATFEQIREPIIELARIDRARIGQTNRRDLLVVMMRRKASLGDRFRALDVQAELDRYMLDDQAYRPALAISRWK